jgi:hypothetical protein
MFGDHSHTPLEIIIIIVLENLEMRCYGVHFHPFRNPFRPDAVQVPRLSPDMSVTFSLVPEIEPDPDEEPPGFIREHDKKHDMINMNELSIQEY